MSRAQITVCIPAYNRTDFLHQALASLCDQGLAREDYAVVVTDDASPTSLAETVASFDSALQVTYHRNGTNLGHIANYQKSFDLAGTPFVSFLPHDDLMAPGQLGRALAVLKRATPPVLVASLALCQRYPGAADTHLHGTIPGGARGSYAEPYEWTTAEWMALSLATTPLSIVGSVFHADTFRRCQQWRSYPLWHDRLMLAEMGLHGPIVTLPWIGGYYRVGAWQLSGQLWTNDLKEFREVTELLLATCASHNIPATAYWVDTICDATVDERITYLQMLNRSLPQDVYGAIKSTAEARLGIRLHLGGRLDRLRVPRPLVSLLRAAERTLLRR